MYLCTTPTQCGSEKQRQGKNALFSMNLMWWHSSVAGAAIVGTRTVATWHKRSLGSLSQWLFSCFFSPRCAGAADWGRSVKALLFLASVFVHDRDGVSQPTLGSWKKKHLKEKEENGKQLLSKQLCPVYCQVKWLAPEVKCWEFNVCSPIQCVFQGCARAASKHQEIFLSL